MLKITNKADFTNLKRRDLMFYDKKSGEHKIRPEVDFNQVLKGLRYIHADFEKYDLRRQHKGSATKAKASRILSEYYSLTQRANVREYRPRKQNRKTVAAMAQQSHKGWKAFYVPLSSQKSELTYKKIGGKRRLVEKTPVATYLHVRFNATNLAINPEAELKRVLKGIKNIEKLQLHAGEHLTHARFATFHHTLERIKEYMNAYANYKDWLTGVKVFVKFNTPRPITA